MTTLLVANRGEIARRIIGTAKRMGMRTVAIHSDADAELPFVREADVAVRIGPAPARESYLAIDRIIAAARETRADLVHPGYGFLSERPSFASAVEAAGMRFVGPPASVLAALGDKAVAKALAERAKVPVLPGYRGDDQSDEAFIAGARATGYPVMIKPVAGGGGIGMQGVRDERQLRESLARARRLASSSFGDERLLLERLIERPRHVEVQVVADDQGNVLSYLLRDCSAQRRHQKIVEESPAPSLDERRHRAIAAAAGTSTSSRSTPGYRSSTQSPRWSAAWTSSSNSCAWRLGSVGRWSARAQETLSRREFTPRIPERALCRRPDLSRTCAGLLASVWTRDTRKETQ